MLKINMGSNPPLDLEASKQFKSFRSDLASVLKDSTKYRIESGGIHSR